MKLDKQLKKANLMGSQLAEQIGTDASMVSKFNNYRCLPVPATMQAICKALNCNVNDIYTDNEITFKKGKRKAVESEYENYKITVKLPRDAKEKVHKALKVCGYKDVTHWIYRCYERLLAQQEIIEKAEKNKRKEHNDGIKVS